MGYSINHNIKIEGVFLTKRKQFKDDRGAVFHYLKSSDETFHGFGEAYYSIINPMIIKGWKLHLEVYQNFCVPFGGLKIVIYDNRENSSTKGLIDEIILDDNINYYLLTMPPGLWYSFKCYSENACILSNIINAPHNPEESINLPIDSKQIPYEWK